ncbi:DNA-3-methyladenine glycosylase 2 family protein [uncultured Oscillibacter sp.]|uniref:DNA-3-methyladenine glycosylase family protein n=1 Tax=uncultured Oscillibacter sp. TaxID=876091 RepID=UPI00280AE3FF|nr:DNA-3-methyladenine glycosylase 2 family protein [uncultured Oscillibacter sp.]
MIEFPYGEQELAHLRAKDRKLGAAIERIGHVHREMEPDLFASVIHHIIGQQVSMAAQRTVWERLRQAAGTVTAETVLALGREQLQSLGMTYRKAEYILDFAEKVPSGAFDLEKLYTMGDEEVKASLSSLRGIGPWTAEMLMLFSMGRPDIVSYGDLAILRGMRMLYGRKTIDRAAFDRYCRRYSPYGTTASLYLWAIACGALPELRDPAAPKQKGAKKAP